MSELGVFAVDRGIFTDPDFADEPFTEREAFMWLVSEAAWKDHARRGSSGRVELRRGEVCHSVRFMAEAWKWSKSRVDRFMKRAILRGMLSCENRDNNQVYLVCNYNKFQRVSLPDRDSSGTAAGQQRDRLEDREYTLTSDTNVSSVSVGSDEPTMSSEGLDKVPSSKPKRTKLAYSEAFEKFWGMYPKTPTMAKKEAWDVWRKMGDEDREDATKSMPAYVRYCRQNPDYPPIHACRFLSKRRWEALSEGATAIITKPKEEDDEHNRRMAEKYGSPEAQQRLEELRRASAGVPAGGQTRAVPDQRNGFHRIQESNGARPLFRDSSGDTGMASLGDILSGTA